MGICVPSQWTLSYRKYKTAVFVHGCFWHRHKGCKNCTTPTNRREWWLAKLEWQLRSRCNPSGRPREAWLAGDRDLGMETESTEKLEQLIQPLWA
jgi:hypothetical protein